MLIGRDDLGELGKIRVAVSGRQIPEYLVVSTVFFDDVDHMLNVSTQYS
jgi:hypothetical protein